MRTYLKKTNSKGQLRPLKKRLTKAQLARRRKRIESKDGWGENKL